MTNKKDIGFDLPLLTAEKVEEIRLSAFLGAAYQRLFQVKGEIGRMEAEIESLGVSQNAFPKEEWETEEFQELQARRVLICSRLGIPVTECQNIQDQINLQTT